MAEEGARGARAHPTLKMQGHSPSKNKPVYA